MQKAACPCLEDSPPCGSLDLCALGGMTTLNILPYQASGGGGGFHYTCVCCCLCPWSQNRNPNILLSAAGGVEGATAPAMDIGSRNGWGGVASLDTPGSGMSAQRPAHNPCETEEKKAQLGCCCRVRHWECIFKY